MDIKTFKEIGEILLKNIENYEYRAENFTLNYIKDKDGQPFENILEMRYKNTYVYTLDVTQLNLIYYIVTMFLRGIDYENNH